MIVPNMCFFSDVACIRSSVDFAANRTSKLLNNTQTVVYPYESRRDSTCFAIKRL